MDIVEKKGGGGAPPAPWKGKPPKNDEEARTRIIQAARECIELDNVAGANISTVAKQVGVTRRTIYRLFDSTGTLIQAIAAHSTGDALNKMVVHVNKYPTFQERLVEAIIFLRKALKKDSFLNAYLATGTGKNPTSISDTFAPEPLEFALQMVKMLYPHSLKGIDEQMFRQLAEHMQRIYFSITLAPSPAINSDKNLRVYLENWFVPCVDKMLQANDNSDN